MTEERVERRVAAILAGDIVGYSRLMGVDEEGTQRLKALRRQLVDPKIKGSGQDRLRYTPMVGLSCMRLGSANPRLSNCAKGRATSLSPGT